MEQKLDKRQALRAFAKISEFGEKTNRGICLQGLCAESDFDGYNIILSDDHVKLHLHFHNTYDFEFDSTEQLEHFIEKIKNIDQKI